MHASNTRTCPDCGAELQVVHHEGVEIDRCPGGHGIWLDRGELRQVVASEQQPRSEDESRAAHDAARGDAGKAIVAEMTRAPRACPVCGTGMRLTEYATSGVAIDECGEHGVWLDDGELAQIEAYAEGVRRMARTGAAAASVHQVAGIDIPADLLATIRTVGAPPPG